MNQHRILIGVIGSSQASSKAQKVAYEVGRQIIRAGYALLCGGLGGVMEAASKGAYDEAGPSSGCIVGILPGSHKEDANPYIDIVIPTGMGYSRNMIIACASDAVIVIEGGSGTLSELAMAWQFGKPIIAMEKTGGIAERFVGARLDKRREYRIEGAGNALEALIIIEKWLRQTL